MKVFSKKKKKGLHFNSLILDFLFCYRNQTLPTLIQRKHVLPKLTQCAAKRKYCAGFSAKYLYSARQNKSLRGGSLVTAHSLEGTVMKNMLGARLFFYYKSVIFNLTYLNTCINCNARNFLYLDWINVGTID